MREVFIPRLINGPAGDPGLWVDLLDEGRSILLDLGDLHAMAPRPLLRVERVVVTHTHMDHFVGFDRLVRLTLSRPQSLALHGPAGFIDRVEARLRAYTWNLIRNYPIELVVEELNGDTVKRARFRGVRDLEREPLPSRPFDGALHREDLFEIQAGVLDHGVPVLGIALQEREHLSIDRAELERMGLATGPWLHGLKGRTRRRELAQPVEALTAEGGTRMLTAEELEPLVRRGRGRRLAYLTDFSHTPANVEVAVALAKDADLLVCEASFLHADRALARERNHLTTRQCGELARAAGVRRLAPFHFSPRYGGQEEALYREVEEAFGAPVRRL